MARVLVCDDDANIRELVAVTLGGTHEVSTVENGAEVLTVLESEWSPDVLVLDVMMPEMDGFETLERVRRAQGHASVGVVMLTARVGEDDYLRGWAEGADAYLSKPFDPELLERTIDEVLARSGERRAAVREEERAKATLLRQLEQRFI